MGGKNVTPSLPNSLRKAMVKKFAEFDEYQLGKLVIVIYCVLSQT